MLIYADFNCLEVSPALPDEVHLDLTGYGTLASLSLHQVRLRVGQHLSLCDPDGLQVIGEIGFDPLRRSLRSSGWFAKFKRRDIQEGAPLEHDYATHLCFKCRQNLKPYLDKVGRQFQESCPHCGTPVMFPLLPPGS
ncbi:hypothetical protein [Hylemonella gracilis]|uniref:Uncharacterized protein n=1 Tax=Hylemonella gracilis ATCC 19624 TaxID=887062 RepID=F3KPQ9_9BURK|nr:hypothetical protein [Hylemonella gracilis]EGI78234.1 hypothetical protein HGR_02098 [Hylemonella gracilis ATCC 19624]